VHCLQKVRARLSHGAIVVVDNLPSSITPNASSAASALRSAPSVHLDGGLQGHQHARAAKSAVKAKRYKNKEPDVYVRLLFLVRHL
jgi:hypothetical protein